jgi:hypothetical protein
MAYPDISTQIKVTALLLLALGTILFFNYHERYAVVGPELIRNAHFHPPLPEWKHSARGVTIPAPGTVELQSTSPDVTIHITQDIPDARRFALLRLTCQTATRNVRQGIKPWMTARVILLSHDRDGKPLYRLPHTLTNRLGTHDWKHHERVFSVARGASKISLSLQLARASGTLLVRNLSLRPVTEKASYRKLRLLAILLWVSAACWVTVPLVRSATGNTSRIIFLALGLLIIFGTLMPESLKLDIGTALFPSLAEIPVIPPDSARFRVIPLLPALNIFKAGHFVLFALFAGFAFSRRPYKIPRNHMLGYLLLFALITEVLQLLDPGRTASLGDLLIDSAGIVTGIILTRIMQIFRKMLSD